MKDYKIMQKRKSRENLLSLESQADPTLQCNMTNITRGQVLDGGLKGFTKTQFNPGAKLEVKFAGEFATDNGGPTREFLQLMMSEAYVVACFLQEA